MSFIKFCNPPPYPATLKQLAVHVRLGICAVVFRVFICMYECTYCTWCMEVRIYVWIYGYVCTYLCLNVWIYMYTPSWAHPGTNSAVLSTPLAVCCDNPSFPPLRPSPLIKKKRQFELHCNSNTCLFLSLSLCLSVYLSISMYLSIYLSIYLSVALLEGLLLRHDLLELLVEAHDFRSCDVDFLIAHATRDACRVSSTISYTDMTVANSSEINGSPLRISSFFTGADNNIYIHTHTHPFIYPHTHAQPYIYFNRWRSCCPVHIHISMWTHIHISTHPYTYFYRWRSCQFTYISTGGAIVALDTFSYFYTHIHNHTYISTSGEVVALEIIGVAVEVEVIIAYTQKQKFIVSKFSVVLVMLCYMWILA